MPTLVTLYDVEQSVEQGIDGWLACVTNVDEAYGIDGYKYSAPGDPRHTRKTPARCGISLLILNTSRLHNIVCFQYRGHMVCCAASR
jgi:hypothetical protein